MSQTQTPVFPSIHERPLSNNSKIFSTELNGNSHQQLHQNPVYSQSQSKSLMLKNEVASSIENNIYRLLEIQNSLNASNLQKYYHDRNNSNSADLPHTEFKITDSQNIQSILNHQNSQNYSNFSNFQSNVVNAHENIINNIYSPSSILKTEITCKQQNNVGNHFLFPNSTNITNLPLSNDLLNFNSSSNLRIIPTPSPNFAQNPNRQNMNPITSQNLTPNLTNNLTPHFSDPLLLNNATSNVNNQSYCKRTPAYKKTMWTAAEDHMLMNSVKRNGTNNWGVVANDVIGRTGKQCRERWAGILNPCLTKRPWTDEEDQLLIQLHSQYGNKWAYIAAQMNGRSTIALRNRWSYHLRHSHSEQQQNSSNTTQIPIQNHQNHNNPNQNSFVQIQNQQQVHQTSNKSANKVVMKPFAAPPKVEYLKNRVNELKMIQNQ
ncbi:hypothetical protein TRFO_27572 [Tritrichomonas foetus]|uniref:Myb-like DNA-binding domain containing protein n=1 Tax=Tritrichomonas foetus TaxID=1144522 RepID=A0A1J4K1L8_9EUKA|nr:hypothetical protein TRFO_27572 [Tritrichomonas foetus]|eukprot:OHT04850.1 hypothetical protein TRFO_27572 [Tritrichomonas foetus]